MSIGRRSEVDFPSRMWTSREISIASGLLLDEHSTESERTVHCKHVSTDHKTWIMDVRKQMISSITDATLGRHELALCRTNSH